MIIKGEIIELENEVVTTKDGNTLEKWDIVIANQYDTFYLVSFGTKPTNITVGAKVSVVAQNNVHIFNNKKYNKLTCKISKMKIDN